MPDITPDEKLLAPSTRRLSLEGRRAQEMLVTSGRSGARMDDADRFKPLAKIAELMRSLTYGEMMEVASELRKAPVETKQVDKLATLIRCLSMPISRYQGPCSNMFRPGILDGQQQRR